MKNLKLGLSLLVIVSSLALTGCKDSLDLFSTTKEIITNETWAIDYYFSGQDNTSQYHGYDFEFNGDGSLTISNGAESYTGTWGTFKGTDHEEIMTIDLQNSNNALSQLETEWEIGATSFSSIAMKNSDNTQLRFRKN